MNMLADALAPAVESVVGPLTDLTTFAAPIQVPFPRVASDTDEGTNDTGHLALS
jgi:hypothetical protein